MKYHNTNKQGNFFDILEHQRKIEEAGEGILKLKKVVDWESFRPILEKQLGYTEEKFRKGGRPPFDPVLMFQVLVLQKYHGLSDEGTQRAINDRYSFFSFLGLTVGDRVPDANTIWDFREKLGVEGVEELFSELEQRLEKQGVVGREGSLVDASFVDAPKQRNSREENQTIKEGKIPESFEENPHKKAQKDVEARWAKKNEETHYGYKTTVNVDAKTKIIVKVATTSANVHDSQEIEKVVGSEDREVVADSGYDGEPIRKYVEDDCGCKRKIIKKAVRGKALSEEEKASNKAISRVRARVEHVFGRMRQMGMDKVRSIGMKRAEIHNILSGLVYNMDRMATLKIAA